MNKDIDSLLKGYKKFKENHFKQGDSTFQDLVRQGQKPKALVIACSDSRVDPALVLNCQPGDLFVIRNVANLVPPCENDDQSYHGTSAALEFGITVLEIPQIILFGHTPCGGIQSLLEHSHQKSDSKSFLAKWMELANSACKTTMNGQHQDSLNAKVISCGQHSLINSFKNLETFPWIAERRKQGLLQIHLWNFHMAEGILETYNFEQNSFKVIGDS